MYEHEKERYDKEVKEYHERESSSHGNVTAEVQSMMGMEAQNAVNALMMDTWLNLIGLSIILIDFDRFNHIMMGL